MALALLSWGGIQDLSYKGSQQWRQKRVLKSCQWYVVFLRTLRFWWLGGKTEAVVFFLLVLFWKQFQGESGRKWKVRAIFSEIQVMTIPLTLSSMNMTSFLGCVWWICLHLSHRWNDIQGKGQLVHVVFEVMVIERFHLSSPAQTVARRSHQQSLLTLSKAVFWFF